MPVHETCEQLCDPDLLVGRVSCVACYPTDPCWKTLETQAKINEHHTVLLFKTKTASRHSLSAKIRKIGGNASSDFSPTVTKVINCSVLLESTITCFLQQLLISK